MTALPLTLIGGCWRCLMFGSSLSMFSIIGVVMLMGPGHQERHLLVDFAIRAREDHTNEQGQPAPGMTARRLADGGARAAAPHPHDHAGHDLRHGATGLRRVRRLRATRPWARP